PEAVSSSASGPMLGAGSGLPRCAPRRTRALEVSEMPRVLVPLVSLAVLLSSSPVAAQDRNRSPERWQRLARELLAELVAINTTAAEAMRRRLLAAGFPEEDVVVVEPAPRKGNLVARLRGRGTGEKPILLLAHIDVVEADPADWTLPPFELIERDGTFYGRGT